MKKVRQTRLMNLRISDLLYDEYKEFCEENSFSMSKRLRKLMQSDIEKWKLHKAGKLLR